MNHSVVGACFLHELQIKTVQHSTDGNAEQHPKDAECFAADCNSHQHKQSRKSDGLAANRCINQWALHLLLN